MNPTLITLALVLLVVCAVTCTAFPILYAWERRDQRPRFDRAGWYIMALAVCLALMLDFTVLGWFAAQTFVLWASFVLYVTMTALVGNAIRLVLRQRRRRSRGRPAQLAGR